MPALSCVDHCFVAPHLEGQTLPHILAISSKKNIGTEVDCSAATDTDAGIG